MAPDRQAQTAARNQNAVRLRNCPRGRPPDPAETRDDVEGLIVPRQLVHVADSQVGVRGPIAGNGEKPW